jgi:hypothetical protein
MHHPGRMSAAGSRNCILIPDVIAGLAPAIHHFKRLSFLMDARVKPAHDGVDGTSNMPAV